MPEGHSRWKEIDEKLAADDVARVVERQVNQLDREHVDQLYRGVGRTPFDPVILLKMVLYQYLKGRQSPATWYEEARLNEAMQWLGRGYQPARRTWYEFRDRLSKVVEQLHEQLIQNAIAQDHLDPTIGVQDGTFVAACASRHRMVSREQLHKRQQLLASVIDGTLPVDEEVPKWIPTTDSGRLDLAHRMEVASECAAATCDAGTLAPMIDKTQRIVGGRLKTMLADGAYCSILDLRDAENRNVDLLAPVPANSSTNKRKTASGEQQIPRSEFTYDATANSYTCPAGHTLPYREREGKQRFGGRTLDQYRYQCSAAHCQACPLASRCLAGGKARTIRRMEGEELLEAQRTKMERDDVKARYALRGQTVERSFGDAKGNRRLERFHGRGITRVSAETGLLVLAQNLQLLDRLQRTAATPSKNKT